MAVVLVAEVRKMLAGQLHLVTDDGTDADPAKLKGFWTPIATRATDQAERWLRNALAGFGEQAIARWPLFGDYQMQLALFWCGVYGAAELTDDQRLLLQKLDCREEIAALESIGDDPDSTDDNAVQGGRMVRADDIFAPPSVGVGGSLPGDIFNTPPTWTHWR